MSANPDPLTHASPRKKFSTASRHDKIKRSALYKEGQHRLWINGRKVSGSVRLVRVVDHTAEGERLWLCELMRCEGELVIGEYDLGTEVTGMEALAWASI